METSSTKVGISDRKLRKSLNTWDLLFLSLGGIIGSGWLFAAFAASGLAGPASILSWIIGGVIVLIISLNYAELGAMIPRSGSIVRYGQFSHGNFAGYFLAWAYFLSAVSVPAIEAEAVVGYASAYYPTLYNGAVLSATGIVFAGLLMVLFFFLNYFGIKVMGKTNTGMTWWKLVLPIATIVILMAVHFSVANFTTRLATSGSAFMPYGFAPVLAAVATSGIVFSFLGFRQGLDYAGEAKTPQKSVPIATVFSVLIGIAIYVLLQVAFIGAINWHTLGVPSGSWNLFIPNSSGAFATTSISTLYSAPFATLASSAGLVGLSYVLFADAYVSPSGTLSVYLGTSMRTLFGIGMLKFLPKSLTKVNDKYRIPVLPLFVSLILGFVFFAPFPSWYKLVGFITGATVFTYIVGGPSLRVLRKHAPELQRPFKLPGSEILAPLAFIGASLVVYWSMWPTVGYLAIAIALGLIVYAIFYLGGGKANGMVSLFSREHLMSGMWVPVYVIVLSVESYIGESTLGGANYVPYPYDMIMVVLVAIVFYFWSIYSGIKTEEIKTMIDSDSQYVIPEEFGKEGMQEAP
ncbi:MAG: APC family permease [Candidatus Thermoplasmatota archaeon]|jgi:amino acid transporter|nr:APC family permease [Candidatus Thermoplasmatota archaeon]MCL5955619.1 APC family permease [Candidatus Thermoplasmatota archaeon]